MARPLRFWGSAVASSSNVVSCTRRCERLLKDNMIGEALTRSMKHSGADAPSLSSSISPALSCATAAARQLAHAGTAEHWCAPCQLPAQVERGSRALALAVCDEGGFSNCPNGDRSSRAYKDVLAARGGVLRLSRSVSMSKEGYNSFRDLQRHRPDCVVGLVRVCCRLARAGCAAAVRHRRNRLLPASRVSLEGLLHLVSATGVRALLAALARVLVTTPPAPRRSAGASQ